MIITLRQMQRVEQGDNVYFTRHTVDDRQNVIVAGSVMIEVYISTEFSCCSFYVKGIF